MSEYVSIFFRVSIYLNAYYNNYFRFRYLGSGNSITDLHFKFKRAKSTIAYMIQRVCRAIWTNLLRDNIPELTTESFQTIARGFDVKANFPHCVGAIDGKHIRVCNPANSGSLFFNYKAFFFDCVASYCGFKLQIRICRHRCIRKRMRFNHITKF